MEKDSLDKVRIIELKQQVKDLEHIIANQSQAYPLIQSYLQKDLGDSGEE